MILPAKYSGGLVVHAHLMPGIISTFIDMDGQFFNNDKLSGMSFGISGNIV